MQGAVTRIEWVNPRAFFFINVRDASGTVANWSVEFGNPLDSVNPKLLREDGGVPMGVGKRDGELSVWSDLSPARYSLAASSGDRCGCRHGIEIKPGSDVTETVVVSELAARLRVVAEDEALPYSYLVVRRDGVPVAWRAMRGAGEETLNVPAGLCEVVLEEEKRDWKQMLSVVAVAGQEIEVVFPPR